MDPLQTIFYQYLNFIRKIQERKIITRLHITRLLNDIKTIKKLENSLSFSSKKEREMSQNKWDIKIID